MASSRDLPGWGLDALERGNKEPALVPHVRLGGRNVSARPSPALDVEAGACREASMDGVKLLLPVAEKLSGRFVPARIPVTASAFEPSEVGRLDESGCEAPSGRASTRCYPLALPRLPALRPDRCSTPALAVPASRFRASASAA